MARKRYTQPPLEEKIEFNPEIKKGVLAVFLFLLAGLSVLSFFDIAGAAGKMLDSFLSLLFGVTKYAVPVVLVAVAIVIEKDQEENYKPTHFVGFVLFFLSLNGFIHLFTQFEEQVAIAMQGLGGGVVGLLLAWPLTKFLGFWASIAVLAAMFVVSVLFLFNTSLASIIDAHKKFFAGLGGAGTGFLGFSNFFRKDGVKIKGEYDSFEDDDLKEEYGEDAPDFKKIAIEEGDTEEESEEDEKPEDQEEKEAKVKSNKDEIKAAPRPIIKDLPSLGLLSNVSSKPTSGDIKANAQAIKDMLANFGIEVDMGEVRVGPTITQYSFKPAKGVKLSRITTLSNDLALALAAHPIRIEAPIPGMSLVGIEVPNKKVAMVTLRELLTSAEFKERKSNMEIALGKDVMGKVWFADLPKMPHLLVAGATGSGKTVCINTIILSLLYQNDAAHLRFIMVDPKRVELTLYNGIPHLLTPVITDVPKTVSALKWATAEMDRRFDLLAQVGARDIISYNKKAPEPLPYIVFVIDELADLMSAAGAEIEAGVIRIAQMARAVGIHLIVATQRPSTDVITGLIKANIPARIAFSVASLVDSRTILDASGAEKLLGRGDMLLLTAELSKPKRIQGAFVSEEEMKNIVEYLKGDELPAYDDSITKTDKNGYGQINIFGKTIDSERDTMYLEAKKVIIESQKASASFLQRRLKLGYARAARILDELESAGIVGPGDGAKPREVLMKDMEDAEIEEDKQYFEDDNAVEEGATIPETENDDVDNEEETNEDESENTEQEITEEEKTDEQI